MIVSLLYFDFSTSNKLSHLSLFCQYNFANLALVLYISHCFLYNEAILLEFTYKEISMTYTVNNTHM